MIYSVGIYKVKIALGIPMYHLIHQLTVDKATLAKDNAILGSTQGTYVAITGCTDGIGKALTLEFAKRGYGTYLLGRNTDKLYELERQITK